MNVRELYEQLLEGNSIVLEFSSRNDYLSIYAQMRSIKSRFDSQFKAIAGSTISNGKVIRTERQIGDTESYKFSLADKKIVEKIQFKILDIVPDAPVNEAGVQLELPAGPEELALPLGEVTESVVAVPVGTDGDGSS